MRIYALDYVPVRHISTGPDGSAIAARCSRGDARRHHEGDIYRAKLCDVGIAHALDSRAGTPAFTEEAVHEGSAVTATFDGRLDDFGKTVETALDLVRAAPRGRVFLSRALTDDAHALCELRADDDVARYAFEVDAGS